MPRLAVADRPEDTATGDSSRQSAAPPAQSCRGFGGHRCRRVLLGVQPGGCSAAPQPLQSVWRRPAHLCCRLLTQVQRWQCSAAQGQPGGGRRHQSCPLQSSRSLQTSWHSHSPSVLSLLLSWQPRPLLSQPERCMRGRICQSAGWKQQEPKMPHRQCLSTTPDRQDLLPTVCRQWDCVEVKSAPG